MGWAHTPLGVLALGKLSFLADLTDILEATPVEGRLPRILARTRSLRATQLRAGESERLALPAYAQAFRIQTAWRVFEEGSRRMATQLGARGWPIHDAELRALVGQGLKAEAWEGVYGLAEAFAGHQLPSERCARHRLWWQRADETQGIAVARYELWRGYDQGQDDGVQSPQRAIEGHA